MTDGASGVPTIYPTILYDDAKAAIRTLTQGLGFTEEAVYEGRTAACCMPSCPAATAG